MIDQERLVNELKRKLKSEKVRPKGFHVAPALILNARGCVCACVRVCVCVCVPLCGCASLSAFMGDWER